jgi:type I restriction enzyme S subunit
MSKIEQLIQQYCPDGVEYLKLGQVIKLEKGKQLNKELLTEFGDYPAYNGGLSYSGFTDKFNYEENKIIISQGGASAGFVNYVTTKFYANAHCYVVLPNVEIVLNRYVFHFLKLNQENLTSKQHGAGIPALRTSEILQIPIPIPPLPIQQEIVTILDKFTQLEAELEAELEARSRQYEYYRNQLLSFEGKEVEWKTLGDVGEFIRGKRFVRTDMIEEGTPCIHYGEMYTHYNIFAKESKSFVNPELAKKLRVASYGDVVIVAAGETVEDIGKGTAWLGEEDVVIHDACFTYKSELNPKYVSYFLRTKLFHNQIKRHISSGKISAINAKGLAQARIPIPSLEEQERIVNILDQFDALVNDIKTGLPAEIKARRAQYEYYRKKLLTFNRVINN